MQITKEAEARVEFQFPRVIDRLERYTLERVKQSYQEDDGSGGVLLYATNTKGEAMMRIFADGAISAITHQVYA